MQNATYHIRRHTHLRRLCKLLLNLSILALFGFLVWFGGELFTRQWPHNPVAGAAIFVVALVALILLFRLDSHTPWQPSMGITVLSLVLLFAILAFAGVEPLTTYKDTMVAEVRQVGQLVRHEVPQYVQAPIETKVSVGRERAWPFDSTYLVTITILPTSAARLDTWYKVRASSPYWDDSYEWDILWSDDPELRMPEARGFHNLERTFLIRPSDPLYSHMRQLDYRRELHEIGGWTMRAIENDYQNELTKLLNVKAGR